MLDITDKIIFFPEKASLNIYCRDANHFEIGVLQCIQKRHHKTFIVGMLIILKLVFYSTNNLRYLDKPFTFKKNIYCVNKTIQAPYV